jgi:hypothetical protein
MWMLKPIRATNYGFWNKIYEMNGEIHRDGSEKKWRNDKLKKLRTKIILLWFSEYKTTWIQHWFNMLAEGKTSETIKIWVNRPGEKSEVTAEWRAPSALRLIYGLDDRKFGFNSRKRQDTFLFSISSRTAQVPTLLPIQRVLEVVSPGVKWKGREADHSPSSTEEVKSGGTLIQLHHTSYWHRA